MFMPMKENCDATRNLCTPKSIKDYKNISAWLISYHPYYPELHTHLIPIYDELNRTDNLSGLIMSGSF